MFEIRNQLPREINAVQWWALIVGIAGIGVSIAAWIVSTNSFFTAYLYSFMFWLGISLGCMALVMLHHLTGGKWGRPVRGIMEAAMTLVPLMAIFSIPMLFGLPHLFPWAVPKLVAHNEVLAHASHYYLNWQFFVGRVGCYFVIWSFIAVFLSWASLRFQENNIRGLSRAIRYVSGLGIPIYFITLSFACVDWVLSRQIGWTSTVIGFIFLCGEAMAGWAFTLIILRFIIETPPVPRFVNSRVLIDFGNLLLTLVILWSYMSFAQLLVIWSGNIRSEVTWYVQRGMGHYNGWRIVGILLIVLHFFVPFFLLLFRYMKRHLNLLTAIAAGLLVMRVIDIYWNVVPSSLDVRDGFVISWVTPFPLLGIGGIWMFLFVWLLRRRPLVSRLEGEPEPILGYGNATPELG